MKNIKTFEGFLDIFKFKTDLEKLNDMYLNLDKKISNLEILYKDSFNEQSSITLFSDLVYELNNTIKFFEKLLDFIADYYFSGELNMTKNELYDKLKKSNETLIANFRKIETITINSFKIRNQHKNYTDVMSEYQECLEDLMFMANNNLHIKCRISERKK